MKWLYLILIIQVISCFLVTLIVFELGNHEDESSAYNRNLLNLVNFVNHLP